MWRQEEKLKLLKIFKTSKYIVFKYMKIQSYIFLWDEWLFLKKFILKLKHENAKWPRDQQMD